MDHDSNPFREIVRGVRDFGALLRDVLPDAESRRQAVDAENKIVFGIDQLEDWFNEADADRKEGR